MATRAQLERMADENEAEAAKLESHARKLREQAVALRAVAAELVTIPDLHTGQNLSSVDSTKMDIDHKLAISRGRKSSSQDAEFKAAYRSRNLTLTSLAAKVDCDAPLLSKYRRKLRRIPQERAEKIARLIPWPADAKHWPGGIVAKD